MGSNYNQLVNTFIRPPRHTYNPSTLGPSLSRSIFRHDFSLQTPSNDPIQVSHYYLTHQSTIKQTPVLLYCHCNSGNRLEALDLLPFVLKKGISIVSFDFRGCGNSDGDYVTLGHQEAEDIGVIVKYLRNMGVSSIGLWGRSMGGASALRFRGPVVARVIDSTFSDLETVAIEVVQKKIMIPAFMVKVVLSFIKDSVKEKVKRDIFDPPTVEFVKTLKQPVMFVASKQDQFIDCEHTEKLYQHYAGEHKKIYWITGDHNDARSKKFYDEATDFMKDQLFKHFDSTTSYMKCEAFDKVVLKQKIKEKQNIQLTSVVPKKISEESINSQENQNSQRKISDKPLFHLPKTAQQNSYRQNQEKSQHSYRESQQMTQNYYNQNNDPRQKQQKSFVSYKQESACNSHRDSRQSDHFSNKQEMAPNSYRQDQQPSFVSFIDSQKKQNRYNQTVSDQKVFVPSCYQGGHVHRQSFENVQKQLSFADKPLIKEENKENMGQNLLFQKDQGIPLKINQNMDRRQTFQIGERTMRKSFQIGFTQIQ